MRWFVRSLLVLGLGVALLWGGRYSLRHLDIFTLKHIEVLGNPRTLQKEQIVQKADLQLGVNLFAVNLAEVQSRLLQHDFFKVVSISRRLPTTLIIKINEYYPEFILNTGRFYYVDEGGDIFKDITETKDRRDLEVLSGFSEDMILADPIEVKKMIEAAVQLKKQYLQSSFAQNFGLSEVVYEKNFGFILYPEKKKYSIKVGLKDFSEKLKKLDQAWGKIESSKVQLSSIDLNYPGKILLTLKGEVKGEKSQVWEKKKI